MSGKKLTNKLKGSTNVCYLIDVSPNLYTGGGQVHLANLMREVQVQSSKFKVQSFGGSDSNKLVRLLWTFWVIPQVAFFHFFRRQFDLIHAHSLPAMAAGKILSAILGIPLVVTVHGSTLDIFNKDTPSGTGRSILYGFLEKWLLTGVKYDAQITVSRDFLRFPNVNKNVVYIPNGVDLGLFKAPSLRTQGRCLLFVGRKSDPVKGFKVLEEAMELVRQEIPEAKLLVADGSIPRDEVIKMYLRADLFVLPSLSEGFPLTLLEAWARKLPIVASAVGDIPYLIKHGENGFLVSPGDPQALASGILTALNNQHLVQVGRKGYQLARRFTWKLVAKKTIAVYKKVLTTS